ncbi:MAG: hypothetical protein ABI255_04590 [Microbacteriaceae bacterium]
MALTASSTKSSLRAIVRSDIPGVLTLMVTIAATLMFVPGRSDHARWWLIPVALAVAAAFIWRELRFATPFVDLRLLAANAPLLRVYAGIFLVTLVFYSALFGLPQFLDDHGGYRTDIVGALILPLARQPFFSLRCRADRYRRNGNPVLQPDDLAHQDAVCGSTPRRHRRSDRTVPDGGRHLVRDGYRVSELAVRRRRKHRTRGHLPHAAAELAAQGRRSSLPTLRQTP